MAARVGFPADVFDDRWGLTLAIQQQEREA